MTRSLLPLTLMASTALAAPAAAEITPAEVWQDLRAYMEGLGYAVTGTETGGGGSLTLTGVDMVATLEDEAGEVAIALGTVTLTQRGDVVDVTFEERIPIRFDLAVEEGDRATGVVDYTHEGLEMEVGGSALAPLYSYSADTLGLSLAELRAGGRPLGRDRIRADLTLSDVSGSSASEIGSVRDMTQSLRAASLDYDIYAEGDDGAVAQVAGGMAGLEVSAESDLPLAVSRALGAAPLLPGTALFDLRHDGGELTFNATDDGESFAYAAASEGGRLGIDLDGARLGYDTRAEGVTIQMLSSDLPVPLALAAEGTGFALSGPVRPTEEAQPFDMSFALEGFEMADVLWNLFDPGAVLPRDPATLEVALSGAMRQLFDLFDEGQAEALEEAETPAEIETLSLDRLFLEAAGVLLTGTGGFTFDNADLETFDGIPAPDGRIALELTGANQLIDRLVEMGVIPADQAMGARMMMSMFARPAGDDVLTSTLEVRPNGQVLANGQRIR